jgi:hypothetical protein
MEAEARRLTWDFWAGDLDAAPVTALGRETLSWAIDVLRQTFGETWITDNALTSQTVPLLHEDWFPLGNPRVIVGVIELAVQIELARRQPGLHALLDDARRIRSNRTAVLGDFQHLLLELEVAAFATARGWTAAHERSLSTGKKPDLSLSRRGIEYLVEVTALTFDREFRETETWTDGVFAALRALEIRHHVQAASCLDEVLDDQTTLQLLDDAEAAARLTSEDGIHRTAGVGANTVELAPEGQLPSPRSNRPMQLQDVWRRVATRLEQKAKQTLGGPPAWLRLDDVGALFHLTDWSRRSLIVRLEQLVGNVAISLANAPHVHGVILTGAVQYAAAGAIGETAWMESRPFGPGPDRGPSRERLGEGPAALRRILPERRQRLTFVIPSEHDRIVLPPGTGLEPGLWYDDEPAWLDRTLRHLGRPSLSAILR